MGRVGWLPVAALVVGSLAAVDVGPAYAEERVAAAKPRKCPQGTGALVINRQRRCVAVGQVLPAAPAAGSAWAGWSQAMLDLRASRALDDALLPKALRGRAREETDAVLAGLRSGMTAYGEVMDGEAGVATRRPTARFAPEVTQQPVVVTETADSIRVSGGLTSTDSTTGMTGTLGIAGTMQKDAQGRLDPALRDLELSLGIASPAGAVYRVELGIPGQGFTDDLADRCPSADGLVRRTTSFGFRRTRQEAHTTRTTEYRNETLTVKGSVSLRGRVDDSAALDRITFAADQRLDLAVAASRHRPRIQAEVTAKVTVEVTGSLDPASGRVRAAASTITATGRSSLLSDKDATADLVEELETQGGRAAIEAALLRAVAHDYAALKAAERHWRTPNACARLTLGPASATLAPGAERQVSGTVKAADATRAKARLSVAKRVVGSVSGLPGETTPTRARRFQVTAGAAVAGTTADLTVRAVSRAGIATTRWVASEPADDNLYYRVVDASATQHVSSGTAAGPPCSYSVQDVGPWSYSFAASTGPPDGSILAGPSGSTGSVRSKGSLTRPAFTLEVDCGGGPVAMPVEAITFSGVGPQLGFFGDPGASAVTVTFGQISPPPIFDIEGSGADCRLPALTGGFAQAVPLTTLQQTTPFTLSRTTTWSKDVGGTTCAGTTEISMTLQRVRADGSPL